MTDPTRATLLAAALAATGCASLPQRTEWVEARPLQVGGQAEVAPGDRYYFGAVAAINRRDYAAALEMLQLARARAVDDVRVLNAFGVVYDKLGRFDLSRRYYGQAAALEPSSPVVAANIAYSAVLEQQVIRPLEAVQLALETGDLRRVAPASFSSEPAVVAPRIVVAALPLAVAAPAATAQAARTRLSGVSPRAMVQPDLLRPDRLENAPTPQKSVLPSSPIAEAAHVSLAAASPRAMSQPDLLRPFMLEPAPAPQRSASTATSPAPIGRTVLRAPAPGATASLRTMQQPAFAPVRAPLLAALPTPAPMVSVGTAPLAPAPPLQVARVSQAAPKIQAAELARPGVTTPPQAPPAAAPRLVASATTASAVSSQRPVKVRILPAERASPTVVKLARTTIAPRRLPVLTGNALLVVNASGRPTAGAPVVARLARLGWSVPRMARSGTRQVATTSIVYPGRNAAVAHALARTLPYKVRLVSCANRCDRIALVLGSDAATWRDPARGRAKARV